MRGPKEAVIKQFQILLDCLIAGYCFKFLLSLTNEQHVQAPHIIKWVLFDNLLMVFSLIYFSLSSFFIQNSELMKNVFSLYFFQQNVLEKRE